jgi:hypothetical protein
MIDLRIVALTDFVPRNAPRAKARHSSFNPVEAWFENHCWLRTAVQVELRLQLRSFAYLLPLRVLDESLC